MQPDNLQDLVRLHRAKWQAVGKWVEPDLPDALDFMVTEVSEAIEKRLRTKDYIRNNPTEVKFNNIDIAIEIFDAIMMGCVALDVLGLDLMEVAEIKLREMDWKRGFGERGNDEKS